MWHLTPLGGPGLAFSYLNKWGCCKSFGWGEGVFITLYCTSTLLPFPVWAQGGLQVFFFPDWCWWCLNEKLTLHKAFHPLCSVRLTFSWDDDTVADCFFSVSSWFIKRRNQTALCSIQKNQQHHHAVQDPCMDHQLQERRWWSWCILYYNYSMW